MQLFTLGLNHQTAPLAIRERVAFHAEGLRSALAELTLREPVREAAILSTCNRTEIYCALGEPQAALEWLAGYHRVQPQELRPYLYTLPQGEAVRHAFRVASGLDSMVAGAPLQRGVDRASRSARALAGIRHHHFLHREFAADHRQGHDGAYDPCSPPPSGIHGRPRRAPGRRSRGGGDGRRVSLYHR